MKKISFYLIIFFLTTGFLRSDLEKCADYNFRNSNVLPMAEYTTSEVPEAVYKKRYDEYLKKKNIYDQKRKKRKIEWTNLPKCKSGETFGFGKKRTCRSDGETFGQFFFMENLLNERKPTEPSKNETIVKRKFTDNEIERNYKKFFRQSLKTKLRLADKNDYAGKVYLDLYKVCIDVKNQNPQLFKDKYN